MINVDQITSRLAKLPDQALQQYASLHKNDPYIIALAVAESNRRKAMRQAAQAPQGAEQPKVVDQAVAEMTVPEDSGIAQLPVGDMEFAGGGIVAFADGGDVERYQVGGMPPLAGTPNVGQLSAEEIARLYRLDPGLAQKAQRGMLTKELLQKLSPTLAGGVIFDGGTLLSNAAADHLARMTPEQRAQFYSSPMMGAQAGDAGLAAAIMNAPGMAQPTMSYGEQMRKALTTPLRMLVGDPTLKTEREAAEKSAASANAPDMSAYRPRRTPEAVPAEGLPSSTTASQEAARQLAAERRQPKRDADTGSAAPATPTAPAVPAALGDLQGLYNKILASQDYKDPAAAQLSALEQKEREAAMAEKAALERDQAKFADAFKGREKRLDERGAEILKQKDTNTGLAFLNAGLAIMSTPGGLATAIGKGARVGTEQFAAGLDKIRAAQEKLNEARDRYEELRLNRDEMNAKEIRAAEGKIRQVGIEAEKRGIDGIRQAAQVNRETAKDIFGKAVQVEISKYEQGEQTKRTGMTVNAARSGVDQRVFNALVQKHGGDEVKAYQELMSTKREPMTREAALKEWMKPGAAQIIQAQYPNIKTFDDYWAVMSGGAGAAGSDQFRVVGVK